MSTASDQPKIQEVETVPKVWPKAFGLYKHSKTAIMINVGTYVSIFVLSLIIGVIPELSNEKSPTYFMLSVVANIVAVWFNAALIVTLIRSIRQDKISLNDALQRGLSMFGKYFLQGLLLGLIAIASILCLVVPAFFILPRLALAQYYLFDQNMGVVESIKASWEATRGHVGKVWGITGVNILIVLLVLTIIGIPFAVYFGLMYSAAYGILYMWIEKHAGKIPAQKSAELSGPTIPIK